FLFSCDLNNPQSAKLGHVINSTYAIYCNNGLGPSFGGSDLCVLNNNCNWQCNVGSYPSINISGSIAISDYEVFQ
ncbi:7054_t:CDS:1, partial [Scutellospora calospora]